MGCCRSIFSVHVTVSGCNILYAGFLQCLPTRERGRLSTLTLHSTAQHEASILFSGRQRTILDDFVVTAVPRADSCTWSEEMLVRVAAQRDRLPGEGCQNRRKTIWDKSYRCCFSGPRCLMQLPTCPSAGSEYASAAERGAFVISAVLARHCWH